MVCFWNYKNVEKIYRGELLNILWNLNIMSVVDCNIAHTISHFLLEVTIYRNVLKCNHVIYLELFKTYCKFEFFKNHKVQKIYLFLIIESVYSYNFKPRDDVTLNFILNVVFFSKSAIHNDLSCIYLDTGFPTYKRIILHPIKFCWFFSLKEYVNYKVRRKPHGRL